LRDFRVRLACVRHAASVDSEPGSNSHVKFAVSPARRSAVDGTTHITRGRLALRCSIRWSFAVRRPSSRPGLTASIDGIARRRTLTLIVGLGSRSSLRRRRFVQTGFVCACTHYLVFKEPTVTADASGARGVLLVLSSFGSRPSSGEPFEVTRTSRFLSTSRRTSCSVRNFR
jgi:hypothetical protein